MSSAVGKTAKAVSKKVENLKGVVSKKVTDTKTKMRGVFNKKDANVINKPLNKVKSTVSDKFKKKYTNTIEKPTAATSKPPAPRNAKKKATSKLPAPKTRPPAVSKQETTLDDLFKEYVETKEQETRLSDESIRIMKINPMKSSKLSDDAIVYIKRNGEVLDEIQTYFKNPEEMIDAFQSRDIKLTF